MEQDISPISASYFAKLAYQAQRRLPRRPESHEKLMLLLIKLRNSLRDQPTENKQLSLKHILLEGIRDFADQKTLWHFAGKLATSQGHNKEALALHERGLKIDPNDAYLLMSCAMTARELREEDLAYDYTMRLVKVAPNEPKALYMAARAELAAGHVREAQVYCQSLLAMPEKGPRVFSLATQIALAAGSYQDAWDYASQGLAFGQQDGVSLYWAAQAALATNQLVPARLYVDRLLEKDKRHPAILDLATRMEFADGDLVAARAYAQYRLQRDASHEPAVGLAMQIELTDRKPDAALAIAALLPVDQRRANPIVTYFEAKAYLFKGEIGLVRTLVAPLMRDYPDPAFTALYMACVDRKSEVMMLEPLLGPSLFAHIWNNSRDLRNQTGTPSESEKRLAYGRGFWNSEDVRFPVDRMAARGITQFPGWDRRAAGLAEWTP